MDADGEQGAHHDDRGNGVGNAHQRGMEGRCDAPDHEIADENGQHEDGQPEGEGVNRAAQGAMGNGRTQIGGGFKNSAVHHASPSGASATFCGGGVSGAFLGGSVAVLVKLGCTTARSRVSTVALTSSSSQLMASSFVVLSTSVSMNARRLRA